MTDQDNTRTWVCRTCGIQFTGSAPTGWDGYCAACQPVPARSCPWNRPAEQVEPEPKMTPASVPSYTPDAIEHVRAAKARFDAAIRHQPEPEPTRNAKDEPPRYLYSFTCPDCGHGVEVCIGPAGPDRRITCRNCEGRLVASASTMPAWTNDMTDLPRVCPDHPEAHVLHTFTKHRMETRQGGYVGIEWDEQHTYRCAVYGCQQRLAEPLGGGKDGG